MVDLGAPSRRDSFAALMVGGNRDFKRLQRAMVSVVCFAVLVIQGLAAQADEVVEGWPTAFGEVDQKRFAALREKIETEHFKAINSVIVIRDGRLVYEGYFNDAERARTHDPRSVGKTFAAAVLGIALAEGHIDSLDQTLGDFYDLKAYDNYSPAKTAVTLRQLITMTSGFDGFDFDPESVGNEEFMYPQPDWVRWTLDLPMAADRKPGEQWRYFTAGIVVLGDILNRAVPGGLEAYAHEKLFAPLGIDNYEWQHTPQRVANTAGGLQLTPLGFAKFGELYRLRGLWRGQRVIDAEFVEASLRTQVSTTETGNRYGYLWWRKSYEVAGRSLPAAYCSGNGGNKIFVFDDEPLVIVVTASAYGRRYAHRQVDEMMTDYILPAVLR